MLHKYCILPFFLLNNIKSLAAHESLTSWWRGCEPLTWWGPHWPPGPWSSGSERGGSSGRCPVLSGSAVQLHTVRCSPPVWRHPSVAPFSESTPPPCGDCFCVSPNTRKTRTSCMQGLCECLCSSQFLECPTEIP